MLEENKTWNQQLEEWHKNSGKSIKEINEKFGIPSSTFRDYICGRIKNLGKIIPARLAILYELTGLECFKYESPKIQISQPKETPEKLLSKFSNDTDSRLTFEKSISNIEKEGKKEIDKIVEQTTSKLKGMQKLEAGLLKTQRYNPTVYQRADAVMELLDVLSEEIDYFRTAPLKEKEILVKKLQKDPESYGYISQMLNIIYSGKKLDSWMLMAQSPSKIKRLIENQR